MWLQEQGQSGHLQVHILPEQIDVDRAEAAKERAEKKLEKDHENIDFARAEASYERALARLKAAGHHDHGYDRL